MKFSPNTPPDWKEPDWYNVGKVHDWKRYVSAEVEKEWQYFTDEQKQMLARQAEYQAEKEE